MKVLIAAMGDSAVASSRLRVWYIKPYLEQLGHTCEICANSPSWFSFINSEPFDLCLFQKTFSWPIATWERARGRPRIFDCDDAIPDLPYNASAITTDTIEHLAFFRSALHAEPIRVIPDALDVLPEIQPKTLHSKRLARCVAVCNPENLYHLTVAAEAIEMLGLMLTVYTNIHHDKFNLYKAFLPGSVSYARWSLNIDEELKEADLMVCPYVRKERDPWTNGKSANRLLKGWGLGLPVIGTPIPSYVEAGLWQRAETYDEWITALEKMGSQERRENDAAEGIVRANVYRPSQVALLWDRLFREKWRYDEAA
jgi:hypothetical protein